MRVAGIFGDDVDDAVNGIGSPDCAAGAADDSRVGAATRRSCQRAGAPPRARACRRGGARTIDRPRALAHHGHVAVSATSTLTSGLATEVGGIVRRHLAAATLPAALLGAGAAIVGDPDQVLAKLRAYQELGMEAFILSGYPHIAEGDLFARHVLPRLEHGPLFPR